MEYLEPCPFCGCPGPIGDPGHPDFPGLTVEDNDVEADMSDCLAFGVVCNSPRHGANATKTGRWLRLWGPLGRTKEEAIQKWNHRPQTVEETQ